MVRSVMSNLTNIVAETVDMKSSVLILVKIMFITLNPSSQTAVPHCVFTTS